MPAVPKRRESPLGALREGLRRKGYIEGQNIILENRYPDEKPELFESLAIELVQLKVDILVTVTRQAAHAAQRATTTIPIVFISVPDPVESKVVSSLARPGRNITGYRACRSSWFRNASSSSSRLCLACRASHFS